MKQNSRNLWFTCIFTDNRIIQACIPKGWSKAQAEERAKEDWRWRTAIEVMKEKEPGFKLNPPGSDDPHGLAEFDKKRSKLVEIVKALKAPEIKLFQWEKKGK